MAGQAVQLKVAGQSYRVSSLTTSEADLKRLASVVEKRVLAIVGTGRSANPQALLMAAMALAYELEQEQERYAALADRTRGAFGRILSQVDTALEAAGSRAKGDDSSSG